MKHGGGASKVTVAPAYNTAIENKDLVVVGRVADGINSIPAKKDIIKIRDVLPLGAKFARACNFTAPDSTCA